MPSFIPYELVEPNTDLRLFSHVLMDAWAGGHVLAEGHHLEVCTEFTLRFLRQYPQSASSEKIMEIIALLQTLSTGVRPEGFVFCMKGGWKGLPYGHYMIYECYEKNSNELIFNIYNSGSGIKYHQQSTLLDGEKYSPIKTYQFNKPEPAVFEEFKNKLIALNETHKPTDAKKLYGLIGSWMIHFEAKEVLISEEEMAIIATRGQISGTCAQRVIHQFIKCKLNDSQEYFNLILSFKLYTLESTLKAKNSYTILQAEFIRTGIRHLYQILASHSSFLNHEKFEEIASRLKACDQRISILPENPVAPIIKTSSPAISFPEKHLPYSGGSMELLKEFDPEPFEWSCIDFNIQGFEQFLRLCDENHLKHAKFVSFQIETFLRKLPLDFNLSDEIEKQQFLIFLDKLQGIYCKCEYRPQIDTIQMLTNLSFIYFYHQYCQRPFQTLIEQMLFSLSKFSTLPCYYATFNSSDDERLIAILKTLRPIKKIDSHLLEEVIINFLKEGTSTEDLLEIEKDAIESRRYSDDLIIRLKEIKSLAVLYLKSLLEELSSPPVSLPFGLTEDLSIVSSKLYLHFMRHVSPKPSYQSIFIKFRELSSFLQFSCRAGLRSNQSIHDLYREYNGQTPFINSVFFTLNQAHFLTYNRLSDINFALGYDEPTHTYLKGHEALSSTSIQVLEHSQSLDRQKYCKKIDRELGQIYLSKSTQIINTLVYFSNRLDLLVHRPYKIFMMANLFQPGVLNQLLKDNPEVLWESLNEFIEKGIRYFSDRFGHLTDDSIFFFTLYTYVAMYEGKIDDLKQGISYLIKGLDLTSSINVQSSLRRYLLILSAKLYQIEPNDELLFHTYSHLIAYQVFQANLCYDEPLFEKLLSLELLKFQSKIKNLDLSQRDILIRAACQSKSIELPAVIDYRDFPIIPLDASHSIQLNIFTGIIYKNELARASIPQDFLNDELFHHFQMPREQLCYVGMSKEKIELEYPSPIALIKIRPSYFSWDQSCRFEMWKKFDEKWHQYYAFSETLNRSLRLSAPATPSSLPFIFQDHEHNCWIAEDQSGFIQYKGENIAQIRWGSITIAGDKLITLENFIFNRFESKEFFYGLQARGSLNVHSVVFYRYDLVLNYKEGIGYQLPDGSVLLDFTRLILPQTTARLIVSKSEQVECLIPIQIFGEEAASPSSISALEPIGVTHDIFHKIKKEHQFHQKTNYQYCYKNAERYYRYQVLDGHLVPKSTAECLYLIYIFLANQDYQEIPRLLQYIDTHSFDGSQDELQFLSWIVYARTTENPFDIAIKSKLLLIYIVFRKYHRFDFVLPIVSEDHELKIPSLKKFKDELMEKTVSLFKKYHDIERHLTQEFIISEEVQTLAVDLFRHQLLGYYAKKGYILLHSFYTQQFHHIQSNPILSLSHRFRLEYLLKLQTSFQKYTAHQSELQIIPYVFNARFTYTDEIDRSSKPIRWPLQFSSFIEVIQSRYSQLLKSIPNLNPQARKLLKKLCLDYLIIVHNPLLSESLDGVERAKKYILNLVSSLEFQIERRHTKILISPQIRDLELGDERPQEKLSLIPLSLVFFIDEICQEISWFETLRLLHSPIESEYDEDSIGSKRLEQLLAIRKFAEEVTDEEWEKLNQTIQTYRAKELQNQKRSWEELLSSINETIQRENIMAWQAGKLRPLQLDDLIKAFLSEQKHAYLELQIKNPEEIHQRLYELLRQVVLLQQLYRFIQETDKFQKLNILTYRYEQSTLDNPAFLVFQFRQNIGLMPHQIAALERLSSSEHESIEKIIMGGGKSKVLLPCWAYQNANGHYLAIVEVPKALLNTNYQDLKVCSSLNFGQKAYKFEFNRAQQYTSPEVFKTIYENFERIITTRGYLVTTAESIQALELQYLEFFEKRAVSSSEFDYLEKTLLLLQSRTHVMIDEVHLGLMMKKKLNYTLGQKQMIQTSIVNHAIKLYQFLNQLSQEQTEETSLKNRAQGFHLLIDGLVDALIEHEHSPIHDIVETRPMIVRQFFEDRESPDFFEDLTEKDRETLCFYKAQIKLLSQTLSRHYREHYGPSLMNEDPLIKRLAIPYSANQKPNEGCQFGNPLETINYTIQGLLFDGIDVALCKLYFDKLQTDAKFELSKPGAKYKTLAQTPTVIRINQMLDSLGIVDLRLHTMNLKNDAQVLILAQAFKHHPEIIFDCLKIFILSKITFDHLTLHHNGFNRIDMYHHVQGLTGTPYNAQNYHQRLTYRPEVSPGHDGFIRAVLSAKETPLRTYVFSTIAHLLENCSQANTRAIIDIGALISEFTNQEVAFEIAEYFYRTHSTIAYVLFFNAKDEICALSVEENPKIIMIGSSDPKTIQKETGAKPEQCFTYYDQAHTLGTDILQSDDAHAICLISSKTIMQNFLQGVMRMRKLAAGQTIDIILPKDLEITTLDALFKRLSLTEQEIIKDESYAAAILQMQNVIRRDFLNRMFVADSDDKEKLYQSFSSYLIKQNSLNLYELYGHIKQSQETVTLLRQKLRSFLQDWQDKLTAQGLFLAEEKSSMQEKLESIVLKYQSLCHEYTEDVVQKAQILSDETVEIEMQQEQEKQVQIEIAVQIEHSTGDNYPHPRGYVNWEAIHLTNQYLTTLQSTLSSHLPEAFKKLFSNHMLCSSQYAFNDSAILKEKLLGTKIKALQNLLFQFYNGKLYVVMISSQEAENIYRLLQKRAAIIPEFTWLSSIDGKRLIGQRPSDIQSNQEYVGLLEQCQLFAGEISLLTSKKEFVWLTQKENRAAIYEFYQQHIVSNRFSHTKTAGLLRQFYDAQFDIDSLFNQKPFFDYRSKKIEDYCSEESIKEGDSHLFKQLSHQLYEFNRELLTQAKFPHLSPKAPKILIEHDKQCKKALQMAKKILLSISQGQSLEFNDEETSILSTYLSLEPRQLLNSTDTLIGLIKSPLAPLFRKELMREFKKLNILLDKSPYSEKEQILYLPFLNISEIEIKNSILKIDSPLMLNHVISLLDDSENHQRIFLNLLELKRDLISTEMISDYLSQLSLVKDSLILDELEKELPQPSELKYVQFFIHLEDLRQLLLKDIQEHHNTIEFVKAYQMFTELRHTYIQYPKDLPIFVRDVNKTLQKLKFEQSNTQFSVLYEWFTQFIDNLVKLLTFNAHRSFWIQTKEYQDIYSKISLIKQVRTCH